MRPRGARIALVGDFVPGLTSHEAANEAVLHAADSLSLNFEVAWIPTPTFDTEPGLALLEQYDGIFAPGGAYESKGGALAAIRFARERGWPFFGT
jgi:CTP synthase (UTP-ammonia lyase)